VFGFPIAAMSFVDGDLGDSTTPPLSSQDLKDLAETSQAVILLYHPIA
jgi:hypothetical protein